MLPHVLHEFVESPRTHAACDAAELTYFASSNMTVHVYQGRADQVNSSHSGGVGLKVWLGPRWGYAYTESLQQDALTQTLELACAHAKIASDDPDDRPIAASSHNILTSPDTTTSAFSPENLLAQALLLECTVKNSHPAIYNVTDAAVAQSHDRFAILNTRGHSAHFAQACSSATVSVLAKNEQQPHVINPWRESYAPHGTPLDIEGMAEWLARETDRQLHPARMTPGPHTVIFHPVAGRSLFRRFEPMFSAESVLHRMSLLEGKLGHCIASPHVTLCDDPLCGPAPRAIDGDGLATSAIHLIEDGRLIAYLHNDYTARRMRLTNNARASRLLKSARGISASHLQLRPGRLAQDEMMRDIQNGILIMELAGASASAITGDFSYGAIGHVIRDGKIAGFADHFTLAGNFLELLKNISLIGKDVEFEVPTLWGAVGMPAFAVSNLSLAAASSV